METLKQCPVCRGESFEEYIRCKDNVASGEIFIICKCTVCSFLFTNPRPTESECGTYYQSTNYVSHADEKWSLVLFLYRTIRKINLRWKLGIINRLVPRKSQRNILDYGCGLGTFLNYSKQNGWNTTGMDISEDARNVVKQRYAIDVFENAEIHKGEAGKYEIITLWHVLEHVYELDKTIDSLKKSLTNLGYILFALPNSDSYDAKKYGSNWDAYDVPRHIYHYNPDTIQKLMNRHGFELAEMQPMKYDAYYVSIRSEWHSGNKILGIIKGVWGGFISNFKSAGNQNHSSMLYIFKKKL